VRYTPTEAEAAALQGMDETERLHYFITRAMECEEVWSLCDADGWVVRQDDTMPLWPYRVLAEPHAGDGEAADAVSLEHFVYHLLPELKQEGIRLQVMPGGQPGPALTASELFRIFDSKMDEEQYFIEG